MKRNSAHCTLHGPHCSLLLLFGIFSSLALSGFGAGEGGPELTRETIPINPEANAQITLGEITDLIPFTRSLMTAEEGSAEHHLYSFFNPGLKEEYVRWEFEEEYPEELSIDTVKMLNNILRRGDLYKADAFEGSSLAEATRTAYTTGFAALGPVEKARVNRRMLGEVFSKHIGTPITPSFPERPERLHVAGDKFLGSGDLQKGFKIPTGAVWQPSAFFFGTARAAAQRFDPGEGDDLSEIVGRVDLSLNLALTPTERLLVTFRPIDDTRRFTGYQFDDTEGRDKGFEDELDLEPEALFFEGDFGELFPILDPNDSSALDLGFAVGRQPISFQRGFLIDDTVDAIGITKNNIVVPGTSNLRVTGLYAWNQLDRSGLEDDEGQLLGLFSAIDLPKTSVEIDLAAVTSDEEGGGEDEDGNPFAVTGGDSFHAGIGFIQRIGLYSTSLRFNTSIADEETASVGDGSLVFGDLSYVLPESSDILYATAFAAFDRYSAAARRPTAQGPLAPAGILFEGTGLGSVGSALSNLSEDVAGGAVGLQKFYNDKRTQVIGEVGGRLGLEDEIDDSIGIGLRAQHAMGQHWILRADAAVSLPDSDDPRSLLSGGITYQF